MFPETLTLPFVIACDGQLFYVGGIVERYKIFGDRIIKIPPVQRAGIPMNSGSHLKLLNLSKDQTKTYFNEAPSFGYPSMMLFEIISFVALLGASGMVEQRKSMQGGMATSEQPSEVSLSLGHINGNTSWGDI